MIPTDEQIKEQVFVFKAEMPLESPEQIDKFGQRIGTSIRDLIKPELYEMMEKQAKVKPELLELSINERQKLAIASIELIEHVQIGKCECGQEHDIRFMVQTQDGNYSCFECYRAWVGEFGKHVKHLLKWYVDSTKKAKEIRDKKQEIEAFNFHKMFEYINKIGENYTNVGKGWEEHVNENWEE